MCAIVRSLRKVETQSNFLRDYQKYQMKEKKNQNCGMAFLLSLNFC